MKVIPVSRTPLSSQRLELDDDGTEFKVRLKWVSRYQRFYMSIYDVQDNPLVLSLKLVPGAPINVHTLNQAGPVGLFIMDGKGDITRDCFETGAYTLLYLSRSDKPSFPLIRKTLINNDVYEFLVNYPLFIAPDEPVVPEFFPSDISGLQLWVRGDSITDLSSNNYPITNNNVTITSSGLNDQDVLEFNGTDAYLEVANSVIGGTGSRSVYAVYKSTRTGTYVDAVAGKSQGTTTGSWFTIQSRTHAVTGDPYLAGYSEDLTGPTPDNAWKYVCVNYDGTTAKSYKNGTLVNSGAKSYDTVTNNFIIGADNEGGSVGRYLQGQIAEVIVYNTVLSAGDNAKINLYISEKFGL